MYSSASHSQLSNNPFIDDPTNSSGRFPDINTLERSSSGFASPSPGPSFGFGGGGSGYGGSGTEGYNPTYASPGQPQQPQQYLQQSQSFPGAGGWPQQQQQQQQYGTGYGGNGGYGYASTSSPVSPQMTGMPYQNFGGNPGQQYAAQTGAGTGSYGLSPYGGGYSGSGGGGYGQQGYGGQPQPQQVNVSEFDPLRQQQVSTLSSSCTLSETHLSNAQSQTPSYSGSNGGAASSYTPSGGSGPGPSGQPHPREYIRQHKAELEIWDNVSWKQALNSFDFLRAAWEGHREQVMQRLAQGGYYLGPAEGQRLQGVSIFLSHPFSMTNVRLLYLQMQREAENNIGM